jgi:8-oxo-dGTP diphosphatase
MATANATEVAAGLVMRDGRVLVCQRRPDEPHAHKWEFPGGKREGGETFAECLRRELREELGIDADVGAEVWRTDYAYPGRNPVRLVFFVVPSYRGEVENRVFAALRWAVVDDLPSFDFLAADRELIDRLVAGAITLR